MLNKHYGSAVQPWLMGIPMMQQSVLFSAIRGPDGFRKHHEAKPLLKFFRRCILMSAFEGKALMNPYEPGGGSFTGPSLTAHNADAQFSYVHFYVLNRAGKFVGIPLNRWPEAMQGHVDGFVHSRDEQGLHYFAHALHAFEILGYKHPVPIIRQFWLSVYLRMVNALHLVPEPEVELDRRLCDNPDEWALKADEAGSCSE